MYMYIYIFQVFTRCHPPVLCLAGPSLARGAAAAARCRTLASQVYLRYSHATPHRYYASQARRWHGAWRRRRRAVERAEREYEPGQLLLGARPRQHHLRRAGALRGEV